MIVLGYLVNPAVPSATFLGLFPDGVAAAELRIPGDPALLLPAEAACLGRAVPKRIAEFAAGRLCARRVLEEFGVRGFALRVAADRQPVWPEFLVGSITHTAGLCGAVAGEARRFAGIGVDSEVAGDVKRDLWPKICVAEEAEWLHSLPADERSSAAALIFAAKEAFYKCQFPAAREHLSFHDVKIEVLNRGQGREQGTFRVHALRDLVIARHARFPVAGRHRLHEEFASAGVALPATPADAAGRPAAAPVQ